MSGKRIAVMLGPHSSGKTTLGRALAGIGLPYFEEIGSVLRSTVDEAVTNSQEWFDAEVMHRELDRDALLLSQVTTPVIESWHLGNLAFALARKSTNVLDRYFPAVRERLAVFSPMIVRLEISDDEFLQRITERGVEPLKALTFYREVERLQGLTLRQFDARQAWPTLTMKPPWTGPEAAERVRTWILSGGLADG